MKKNMKTMLALAGLLALGATALIVKAQDNGGPQNGDGRNGPPMSGHRLPPVPAIIRALDANHDGVIDADEIANAVAVLKSLDKNGDGVLTPDEFDGRPHPPRPDKHDADNASRPNGGDSAGPPDDLPPGPPPDGE
jgi:hypothetical protein